MQPITKKLFKELHEAKKIDLVDSVWNMDIDTVKNAIVTHKDKINDLRKEVTRYDISDSQGVITKCYIDTELIPNLVLYYTITIYDEEKSNVIVIYVNN